MRWIALAALLTSVATSATDYSEKNEPKGFYWYDPYSVEQPEPDLEPQPETTPTAVTPKPVKEEMVQLDAKWLKENLPRLSDKAINQPTDTNLANYYYAQRLMMDYASRFSAATKEFFFFETQLQESRRRPMDSFAVNAKHAQVKVAKAGALKKVFERSGLWVFTRSDCPYCAKQMPVLDSLIKRYHGDVLLIAQDGRPMPGYGMPMVADLDLSMSHQFNVTGTPTMFLVTEDKQVIKLAEGMLSRDALLERLLVASRRLASSTRRSTKRPRWFTTR